MAGTITTDTNPETLIDFSDWSPDKPLTLKKKKTYLKFHTLFHPHVCELIHNLNARGIPGLLTLENQQVTKDDTATVPLFGQAPTLFRDTYKPTPEVHWDYPKENVDFEGGAYSVYNWELFFHAPLLIADRLSKYQRFQAAQDWFHYIFNPTISKNLPSPQRYWNVLPFFNNADPEQQQIAKLLAALKSPQADKKTREDVKKQIAEWRDNPFNPHLIARMRITAYQKTVVMKYIDNLIAWGDQLFRRETIESINEATQLYIMAHNILGPRPETIPPRGKIEAKTYKQLQPYLDSFSNALVTLENEFPFSSETAPPAKSAANGGLGMGSAFYFCIPKNEKLLGYWDTVADRLFKIRHCMNIEGVVRQLPLFEPPIDPMLLVQATAMGLDLNSLLNDINSPLPPYRFSVLLQKAMELCSELKSLGGALLSTLEKKDAEELAMLRASQELSLLNAAREIKIQQFLETKASITALERAKDIAQARQAFYEQVLEAGLNFYEKSHLDKLKAANDKQADALTYELIAQATSQIPNATIGTSGYSSAVMTAQFGGSNLSSANSAYSRYLAGQAADETYKATTASIAGSYKRREDDWMLQLTLANREITQIDKQIATAEIHATVAQKELQHHDRQIENSAAVAEFLQNKYTNQELYSWMLSQISAIFFQSYQLAYDMAKRAERAYRFECGLTSSNFIQFGYWDSLRQGLLSGERLHLALKSLEVAYLDQNKREYEITKHVSLVLHDPLSLIRLKETGQCEVELPEALFDADYPGHYMRRLKSVSLTIPCVVGPYTSINCTLTLLSNKTRINSTPASPYVESEAGEDGRFFSNFAAMQSIATSHAQNDSGMFELNFRDERYLPFEGAGAISRWRIGMPKDTNAFDFNTLSDVVLHLKYTAKEGGEILKKEAKTAMKAAIEDADNTVLARLFSVKHEFPSEWYRFLHPKATDDRHSLPLDLKLERFPFQFRSKTITIMQVELFLKLNDNVKLQDGKSYTATYAAGAPLTIVLKSPTNATESKLLDSVSSFFNGLPHSIMDVSGAVNEPSAWMIEVPEEISGNNGEVNKNIAQLPQALQQTITVDGAVHYRLNPAAIEDLWLICHYALA